MITEKYQRASRIRRVSFCALLLVGVSSSALADEAQKNSQGGPISGVLDHLPVLTALVGFGTLAFGIFQYRIAQRWKRVEFVATEMKIFFDDPDVQLALTMIDWAPRRLNLYNKPNILAEDLIRVDRGLQISALRPHPLIYGSRTALDVEDYCEGPEGAGESAGSTRGRFSAEEARIRDIFDRFLDRLERFASYIDTALVERTALDPYLGYWIADIVSDSQDGADAVWTCALLAYIEFYGFLRIQHLFSLYGFDITTKGRVYANQQNLRVMGPRGKELTEKLKKLCFDSQQLFPRLQTPCEIRWNQWIEKLETFDKPGRGPTRLY